MSSYVYCSMNFFRFILIVIFGITAGTLSNAASPIPYDSAWISSVTYLNQSVSDNMPGSTPDPSPLTDDLWSTRNDSVAKYGLAVRNDHLYLRYSKCNEAVAAASALLVWKKNLNEELKKTQVSITDCEYHSTHGPFGIGSHSEFWILIDDIAPSFVSAKTNLLEPRRGANCYSAVLSAFHYINSEIWARPQEMKLWLNSGACTLLSDKDQFQPGEIVGVTDQSGEMIHAYVQVAAGLVFEKFNGDQGRPYSLVAQSGWSDPSYRQFRYRCAPFEVFSKSEHNAMSATENKSYSTASAQLFSMEARLRKISAVKGYSQDEVQKMIQDLKVQQKNLSTYLNSNNTVRTTLWTGLFWRGASNLDTLYYLLHLGG